MAFSPALGSEGSVALVSEEMSGTAELSSKKSAGYELRLFLNKWVRLTGNRLFFGRHALVIRRIFRFEIQKLVVRQAHLSIMSILVTLEISIRTRLLDILTRTTY